MKINDLINLTSLDSRLLGLTLEHLADSSGSNCGIVDVAEITDESEHRTIDLTIKDRGPSNNLTSQARPYKSYLFMGVLQSRIISMHANVVSTTNMDGFKARDCFYCQQQHIEYLDVYMMI